MVVGVVVGVVVVGAYFIWRVEEGPQGDGIARVQVQQALDLFHVGYGLSPGGARLCVAASRVEQAEELLGEALLLQRHGTTTTTLVHHVFYILSTHSSVQPASHQLISAAPFSLFPTAFPHVRRNGFSHHYCNGFSHFLLIDSLFIHFNNNSSSTNQCKYAL